MAKSIRSKIKRKHRAEFRRTIGTQAASKAMKVVQSKLKECVEKGSLNSFERISSALDTRRGNRMDDDDDDNSIGVAQIEETIVPSPSSYKGENKAPVRKKSRKQKHKLLRNNNNRERKNAERKETNKTTERPKYWCSF